MFQKHFEWRDTGFQTNFQKRGLRRGRKGKIALPYQDNLVRGTKERDRGQNRQVVAKSAKRVSEFCERGLQLSTACCQWFN